MTEIPFVQVDAFADRPFTGNPAAVVARYDWLPDETMQAIARETGANATLFAVPVADGDDDYAVRWFSPAAELRLCGHASLAGGHVLIGDSERVRFHTRLGETIEVVRDGQGYALSLPARKPEPAPLSDLVKALGCEPRETLWHPDRYALLVLGDETAVRRIEPDFAILAERGDLQVIISAPGRGTDIVSRVFTGGAEDPVTGSAHAVLTPYWTERLGRGRLTASQASRRGGRLTCHMEGDRVVLGGQCVTVIEGALHF